MKWTFHLKHLSAQIANINQAWVRRCFSRFLCRFLALKCVFIRDLSLVTVILSAKECLLNKADKTTKMVGLPYFIIFRLLFSSLCRYCKTNGELKSLSCPLCNYGFVLYVRLFSKSSINLSVGAECTCSASKWSCKSVAVSALQGFLRFLCCCAYFMWYVHF